MSETLVQRALAQAESFDAWTPCHCLPSGPADYASLLREVASEIERLAQQVDTWRQATRAKQAQIDRLMLEFCPGEMTDEQRQEWARNQAPGAFFGEP
jgi:hypothetical protein